MRHFILIVILATLLTACQLQRHSEDLPANLLAEFQAVQQAQRQAAQLWDQLIIDGSANCSVGLPTLLPFTLTDQKQSSLAGLSEWLTLINQAILLIQQSAELWDTLCLDPNLLVLPSDANQGYLWIQQAQQALNQAQALQSDWNP